MWIALVAAGASAQAPAGSGEPGPGAVGGERVRGITISCQTYGPEWGTPGFAEELEELASLGVNWIAIHPYAAIRADGTVDSRLDPDDPPEWLTRPIREVRSRGMHLLVKPHLAHWGSPFSWRGAIDFPEAEARKRFFETYSDWIVDVARVMGDADAFAVGTELDLLIEHEALWRELIDRVREVTPARLTYASNWPDYDRVPFWDALDAIGVQAYFPLAEEGRLDVTEEELEAGWQTVLPDLRALHERLGKPVVFTELGYNLAETAASRPWEFERASGANIAPSEALQARCYRVAFRVLERERAWLRGAFLWKWFVGAAPWANFLVDTPSVRAVLSEAWKEN